MIELTCYDDVAAAAAQLEGVAHRTPVLRSRLADEMFGVQLFFKCENLQRAGAFKFRGAFNALSRLDPRQRQAGVVTFSSGNHAQAVALSGALLDIPVTIVMPHDAPASKLAATRAYGAQIMLYDRFTQEREALAGELAAERGLSLIPPFDHSGVIAGQGTAAKELFEEIGELDALVAPLGGGGLLAGSLLSAGALSPGCQVYGAEPAAGDDGLRSLRSGRIVTIGTPQTIADGAQTRALGVRTFEIIRRSVRDIITATDDELAASMRLFATYLKLVVEPTGALGLAALHHVSGALAGHRVGVIISGGNIDLSHYSSLLSHGGAERT
jgi:threo-3-hydroxy-L-aspartate ammonia-lyase